MHGRVTFITTLLYINNKNKAKTAQYLSTYKAMVWPYKGKIYFVTMNEGYELKI